MKPVSIKQSLTQYKWGNDCDGWNLVDEASLSVKQERMPPGTGEERHLHATAQQFFYILKGTASFDVEGETIEVGQGEGLYISAGKKHLVQNRSADVLEFLLCSQPSTVNDRINCTE